MDFFRTSETTTAMRTTDSLHRFLFEGNQVRGEIVRLDATWRALQGSQDYPAAVRNLLGEAAAASALLTPTLKFEGKLTLQVTGEGPVHLLVMQCTSANTLRGLARWHGTPDSDSLGALIGGGRMAITIDPVKGRERYQGIVEVRGDLLAHALEAYFQQSEQLDTRLWLAADEQRAVGLLLQQLPGEADDADAWNRVQQLGATLTRRELLEVPPQDLMYRLFSEEDLRVFEPTPLSFRCGCSRTRIESVLRGLGYAEVQSILSDEGTIKVDCEFCGHSYEFDAVDTENLFSGDGPAAISPTRH